MARAYQAAAETVRLEQRVSTTLSPDFLKGAIFLEKGAYADAVASIRAALEPGRTGTVLWRPFGFCVLAQALMCQGDYAEALAALGQGFVRIEEIGERIWEVELHRTKALIMQAQTRFDEAQSAFDRAIAVARDQQAKSFELRSAKSLARLWGEQGRRSEASELLAPVYGWFTEGFDTADLKEAAALLAELA